MFCVFSLLPPPPLLLHLSNSKTPRLFLLLLPLQFTNTLFSSPSPPPRLTLFAKTQLLRQTPHRPPHPARLLGPRGRQAPLHAPRRPPRSLPRLPAPRLAAAPLARPPARRLADAAPPTPQWLHHLQLQGSVHARRAVPRVCLSPLFSLLFLLCPSFSPQSH